MFNNKLILFVQILVLSVFTCVLFRLNVLPFVYTILISGVLLLVNIILFLGNKKNNIISKVITIILCVSMIVPTVYMNKSMNTLEEVTEVSDETNKISLIVMNDSKYHLVEDLKDKQILTNTKYNKTVMEDTIAKLNDEVECNLEYETDFIKMADKLYEDKADAVLVNEAYLWAMEHKYESFEEDTRIIWTYEHKQEKEDIKKPVSEDSSCFNVFISGIDTRGDVSTVSRSDVNMIATVNTSTNQILLTSIPRDYYVYIPELDAYDKLTHAGLNGVNSSVATLENLMDIDINYYARVNFTSLVTMVDALGGIEVYSDYDILYPNTKYPIIKGLNHMNGETALLFSRERYLLPNGDNDRIKNQQRVIQGMLNKLTSPAIITNYMDILDSVAGSFETNMSTKEITSLLKEQLKTMKAWDVQSYSLTGNGSYFKGGAMMPDTELYYCIPDEKSVKKATDYINSMIDGEFIIVE